MLIAISGGIGSGKSIVSKILSALGFQVYDCDSRAKALMDTEAGIKAELCRRIHPQCVSTDGRINRELISKIVFNDADALERLNHIVHSAVRDDILRWAGENSTHPQPLFVETAILYQSGLDRMVDEVWQIEAPLDLRIARVMKRNALTREQVLARITAQDSFKPHTSHHNVLTLINDGDIPLLPQIEKILPHICKNRIKHGQ